GAHARAHRASPERHAIRPRFGYGARWPRRRDERSARLAAAEPMDRRPPRAPLSCRSLVSDSPPNRRLASALVREALRRAKALPRNRSGPRTSRAALQAARKVLGRRTVPRDRRGAVRE